MAIAYLSFPGSFTLSCFLAFFMPAHGAVAATFEIEPLLEKMEEAYAGVQDYQANMEIRNYKPDGSFETERFIYTFEKPKRIRLDFESPHAGMVLVYPDPNGKVHVRPGGWARHFPFSLSPDSSFLGTPSGQRIDQTDLGLLIRNISHSLTDQRRGPVEMAEDDGQIRIRVLAEDHFRKGVVTRYQFLIDRELWLPVQVEESEPSGLLERRVVFGDLRINVPLPDHFFQLNGEEAGK